MAPWDKKFDLFGWKYNWFFRVPFTGPYETHLRTYPVYLLGRDQRAEFKRPKIKGLKTKRVEYSKGRKSNSLKILKIKLKVRSWLAQYNVTNDKKLTKKYIPIGLRHIHYYHYLPN